MSSVATGLSLTPAQAEKRRDQLALALKIGAVALVGVVIAPLIFTLLKATVALIVTGVLGLATIALAPVLSMKLANWKLKAIMDEARRNPIPTLENELLVRKNALEEARTHLKNSLAQVEGFITQAQDAARKYPDMASRWKERAFKAKQLADMKKKSFNDAVASVAHFEEIVERSRTEWKLVLAEAAMNKSLNVIAGDPMAQLKSRVAIESVTDQMNAAFAGLEVALLDGVSSNREDDKGVIDVPALEMNASPSLLHQINQLNVKERAVLS